MTATVAFVLAISTKTDSAMGRLHLPLVLILCVLVPAYDCRMNCNGWMCKGYGLDPGFSRPIEPQTQSPIQGGLRTHCEDMAPNWCTSLKAKQLTTSRLCQHTLSTMICKKTCGRCSDVGDSTDNDSICNLPKEPGVCLALSPSYYYNPREKACLSFNYGGCGGNKNRFWTIEECQQTCGGTNPPSTVSTPLGCEDHNGVYHAEGTSFMNDCNRCHCGTGGMAMCTLMGCHTWKTTTKKPEITARCPPNKSWPKLVGESFEKAEAWILRDCPKLFVQKIWNNGPMTLDYVTGRVRVIVNYADRVVKVPSCCA